MSIADAVGGATAIALAGLVFTGVGDESWAAFTAVFALTGAVALVAAVTARRTD